MKKSIGILIGLFMCLSMFSQKEPMKLLRLEAGYVIHINSLNEDYYFKYMNSNYLVSNAVMTGVNFKFSAHYSESMDIIFGAIAEIGADHYRDETYTAGIDDVSDYVLNGGGVYFGLNPHTRGKNFGLDADLAVGILAYKEYRMIFNNEYEPYIEIYDKKSSMVGALATIGFYLRGKTIGISPELQAIMAGGGNGSFLFYGVNIPLTITF